MVYTPPKKILEKYAELLVNFALGGKKGIKKGDVVYIQAHEIARPLFDELRIAVIKAGGHYISGYMPDHTTGRPDDIYPGFFEQASDEQISYFNKPYYKGLVEGVDHFLTVLSNPNIGILDKTDPKKIILRKKSLKPYMDIRNKKENEGRLTWSLALYGTQALADQAGLSLEEYWEQIIKGCYLDIDDTIGAWRDSTSKIEEVKNKLDSLQIQWLYIKGKNVDLQVKIGEGRSWLGGGGRNIPSFEVFTSPDYRGTEGRIKFNRPLFIYGKIIDDIELVFEKGRVVSSSASKNESLLKEMIKTDEGSLRVGEFSLTDKRLSKITKFMADTLFDENFGGDWGNLHIALGSAYKTAYNGDYSKLNDAQWENLGYNDSAIHSDIVLSEPIVVTGELKDGSKKIIYKEGEFVI